MKEEEKIKEIFEKFEIDNFIKDINTVKVVTPFVISSNEYVQLKFFCIKREQELQKEFEVLKKDNETFIQFNQELMHENQNLKDKLKEKDKNNTFIKTIQAWEDYKRNKDKKTLSKSAEDFGIPVHYLIKLDEIISKENNGEIKEYRKMVDEDIIKIDRLNATIIGLEDNLKENDGYIKVLQQKNKELIKIHNEDKNWRMKK